MSISVGHRAIASAFGWGHSPARRSATLSAITTTAAQAAVEPSAIEPGGPSAVEQGELVCSPWEGLHLAQVLPVTARGNGATTRQQLDEFLNSLMYGE